MDIVKDLWPIIYFIVNYIIIIIIIIIIKFHKAYIHRELNSGVTGFCFESTLRKSNRVLVVVMRHLSKKLCYHLILLP